MSYRRIDVSGEERRNKVFFNSERPELSWVPIEALIINEAYQRPIEKRGWQSIRKIADNFDWGRFSPLLVSATGAETFAIIDGQHRAHAAALCGLSEVPALVVDLTEQEQAAAFSWVNGTITALTALQIYRAALTALEPWAVQCEAAVTRAGCKMMTYNKTHKAKRPGEVYCIGLVRSVIEAGHGAHLIAALEGLRGSANGAEAHFYAVSTLHPLIGAVTELGITRAEIVTRFLDDNDLWGIQERVHKLRQLPEFRESPFTKLLADSIRALLKQWQKERAAA
ncbi:ParB/RepB/Spo0J family partition protein [Roseovarius sp. PS-C2]|uniref:ParB/RepB/Spo0J family partition protein n=1 Tax=Roseovarius sp. PS-C2 TaxID=2820814 RepID=UPI001C0CDFD7|nr:ParB/RepB/Spo0J family partition protein [Roseovarius sp. PS-C2]MBU3262079.1 ParB/RepB/Spo0J family partition protein [Roseovarius sp. PS-C2]